MRVSSRAFRVSSPVMAGSSPRMSPVRRSSILSFCNISTSSRSTSGRISRCSGEAAAPHRRDAWSDSGVDPGRSGDHHPRARVAHPGRAGAISHFRCARQRRNPARRHPGQLRLPDLAANGPIPAAGHPRQQPGATGLLLSLARCPTMPLCAGGRGPTLLRQALPRMHDRIGSTWLIRARSRHAAPRRQREYRAVCHQPLEWAPRGGQ